MIVFATLPILVLPLYVVSVNVTDTVVPLVFWLARDSGGVQDTDVAVVLDAMVPDARRICM